MELQICVVGCGMIAREHIERIQNRIRGARVVAVCDVIPESAKRCAEIAGPGTKIYSDFKVAIQDPEVTAVVVTTPGQFHMAPVLEAIRAGKPVFCEKPLANTAADCRTVVDAEIAGGKHLVQVGFMRRYDRGYKQVKELIDSGKFGVPMVVKCTHRADGVADSYTTAMAVTDTAIHEIDVLPWLIDDVWDEVQCIMPRTSSKAHLPCPSFPTVRCDNQVSVKIEDNWIMRFIDSYDVEIQDWVNHALRGETGGSSAWEGYTASVTADALVRSQTSGHPEKVVTGDVPVFYQKA